MKRSLVAGCMLTVLFGAAEARAENLKPLDTSGFSPKLASEARKTFKLYQSNDAGVGDSSPKKSFLLGRSSVTKQSLDANNRDFQYVLRRSEVRGKGATTYMNVGVMTQNPNDSLLGPMRGKVTGKIVVSLSRTITERRLPFGLRFEKTVREHEVTSGLHTIHSAKSVQRRLRIGR